MAEKSSPSLFDLAGDNQSRVVDQPFWFVPNQIDHLRWNRTFPYQLFLVRRNNGGAYDRVPGWTFTLPIPPESLSLTTPFAINTNVTLGGIVEEHNGAPVRMITFSGTTGVLPLKGAALQATTVDLAASIFAGTIEASRSVASAANQLTNDLGVGTNRQPNIVQDQDVTATSLIAKTSGYYQFRLLQQFFDNYIQFKKGPEGRDYRLALGLFKDEAVYLVTPVSFEVRRSAQSPREYPYTLGFKAWRRINLDIAPVGAPYTPQPRDPNRLSRVLNTLQDARQVLQGGRATIQAVGGDIDSTVFEPLRQAVLFCKDSLGIPLAISDLPPSILQDAKGPFLEALSVRDGSLIRQFSDTLSQRWDQDKDAAKQLKELAVSLGKGETGAGAPRNSIRASDPLSDLFAHPEDYYGVFAEIRPTDLNLSVATRKRIEVELAATRNRTRVQFEEDRDQLVRRAAELSEFVGAGNATYNRTYNVSPRTGHRTPTDQDFDMLFALNDAALALNTLAVSAKVERTTVTTVEIIAGFARAAGLAFKVPRSKFAVPFPYGSTLERLSKRYLGDPNRWGEIAALNGLQAPYVDEEGFEVPLLVNGSGREVVVADSSQLFVGQAVTLFSVGTTRTKRRITNIRKLAPTYSVLALDGNDDLDRFVTADYATVHAFLPDTVNSQQLIYIPSDQDPQLDDFRTKAIPGIDQFDSLIRVGGIDLLLTGTGDLVITPDGDARLAIGLTNIIQQVRTALSVTKGSLLQHPNYGIALGVGASIADVRAEDVLKSIQDTFATDPAIKSIRAAQVNINGPVAQLGISVEVAGTNQLIPISIDVKR